MKRIFMVLGMHRSGTSMVAQVCQCMGAYLGEEDELLIATSDNPDGYFENKEIARIDDYILHICSREWYTIGMSEPDYSCQQIKSAVEQLKVNVQKLLDRSDTIAIKEPRISILYLLWENILKELGVEIHYIWVFRNPLEVAESLKKRDGFTRKHSLLLWAYYNLGILKFVNGKDYLLLNYNDILDDFQGLEELSQLFGRKFDNSLKKELGRVIKQRYRHSNYSNRINRDIQGEFVSTFYQALLKGKGLEENVLEWERLYEMELPVAENIFMDYKVFENIKCLEEKELIIYGAGNYGKRAAEMLQQLGVYKFDFCDIDIKKQGNNLLGGKIFSIEEITEKKNLCVIIAIEREDVRKAVEQTLLFIKGIQFLSFFALKKICKYSMYEQIDLAYNVELYSSWYNILMVRGNNIKNACKFPVLVYQNGKVGSSTVSNSLLAAGVENAHIHRFFFKNDIIGELLFGEEQKDFIRKSNYFQFQSPDYVVRVKKEMKGKKIVTMVREPIAVDLSTIFQWVEQGILDRYLAEQWKREIPFLKILSELMVKIQDRLFDWFNEELKVLSGVDIFTYPFDKEKGYAVISENDVDILILKAEKLSQMEEVLRDFIGNSQIKLVNENVGSNKEYAHLYKEVKEKIELPREYIEHYYKNNPYVDYFYTEQEKALFRSKWDIVCGKQ